MLPQGFSWEQGSSKGRSPVQTLPVRPPLPEPASREAGREDCWAAQEAAHAGLGSAATDSQGLVHEGCFNQPLTFL